MAIVQKEIFSAADIESEKQVVKKKQPIKADVKIENNYVEGLIISTGALNVRKEPNIGENNFPLGTIARGEIVKIDIDKSNPDWVFVKHGNLEGFCMKKFIKINK